MTRAMLLFAAAAVPAAASSLPSGGVSNCGAGNIASRAGGTLAECKAGCKAYAGAGAPCLFIRWGYTGPNGATECILKNGKNSACTGCGPDGHCALTAGCIPGKHWGDVGTTARSCTYNMPLPTAPPAVSPPAAAGSADDDDAMQDCVGGAIFTPTVAQAPTPDACVLACKNYRGAGGPCRFITFGLVGATSQCVLKNGRTGTTPCHTCSADGSCARTAPCFIPYVPSGRPGGDVCAWNVA